MSSSDEAGSGKNGSRAGALHPASDTGATPVEISVRGRIVIRSSSHPPGAEAGLGAPEVATGVQARPTVQFTGAPGVLVETFEARAKKITPAEKPRRRRQVQAATHISGLGGAATDALSMPLASVESGAVGEVEPERSPALSVSPAPVRSRFKRGLYLALVCAAVAIAWALLYR